MPSKFIYEPWLAPMDVQKKAGCIIGQDYPRPIVDHATASKACVARIGAAYKAGRWETLHLIFLNLWPGPAVGCTPDIMRSRDFFASPSLRPVTGDGEAEDDPAGPSSSANPPAPPGAVVGTVVRGGKQAKGAKAQPQPGKRQKTLFEAGMTRKTPTPE